MVAEELSGGESPMDLGSGSCEAVQFLPDRLYFATLDGKPQSDVHTHFFSIDEELEYESFYCDFGPLNIAKLYQYSVKLQRKLKSFNLSKKRIVHYTSSNPQKRVNAAYLIGSFAILYLNKSADEVWKILAEAQPPKFIPFRDAALGPSTYDLSLKDVLVGVEKTAKLKWIDFDNFNAEEYEYYEKVENGDFNWVLPGKILAFCGPHAKSTVDNGYPHHSPETYADYFKGHDVTTIVRLNKKLYDAKRFTSLGFQHVDLFFVDGSTPSDAIVLKFIETVEKSRGAVAVHCKAGLGRTGTLIACYMMKHYRLSASDCMTYIRLCRPGSIIGPQQRFLIEKQSWCWSLGSTTSFSPLVNSLNLSPAKGSTMTLLQRNKNGLNHLLSRVDTIQISPASRTDSSVAINYNVSNSSFSANDSNGNMLPSTMNDSVACSSNGGRESSASASTVDINDNLETRVDASGMTQGDRLMQIKANRRQLRGSSLVQCRLSDGPATLAKPVIQDVSSGAAGPVLRSRMQISRGISSPLGTAYLAGIAHRAKVVKLAANTSPTSAPFRKAPRVKGQSTATVATEPLASLRPNSVGYWRNMSAATRSAAAVQLPVQQRTMPTGTASQSLTNFTPARLLRPRPLVRPPLSNSFSSRRST